ncbi:MAG: hypothetical protein IV090_17550 [Candidatus Sericytochromatia bacterium]|nr:hypothetical protein [Candidatus Sericytochromatia bacterium]
MVADEGGIVKLGTVIGESTGLAEGLNANWGSVSLSKTGTEVEPAFG